MNEVRDSMDGRTDSKRVVIVFATASPYVGDVEWTLTPAKARLLRNHLDEHSEATTIHMIEDLHDRLDIDELAPPVPGESDGAGGESA